ncbi:MAG: hypothetical protein VE98_C0001G0477 [candidate division Kazan bacterium GW2011_GWA1_50_15]|uniref:EamA domain-containing protein n=2 Tax=Bacteria division Kazan-3B-28 TaxID=1798534 RepID=A0A0G1X846_UNCK3|nr:MAG: hypothetical protein VE98_C0001G0477 [candidate division Kazan bacterium GW2011_GWA1_50_15]KKW25835.1 MAG: hypothetical protein VE99_C0001G0474 [candidate division Kazan bacterium GW2011_GWC1_52_13]KKW27151.1 MAG: hypothetical protein VF00_C0001G0086 [candidate division Kazan bacterium GW2011_GWB1_52_7]HCR42439.1 hypothetical protein [Patescibacteria group bacterium]
MPVILLPIIAVVADASYMTIVKHFFRQYGRLTSREFNWLQFVGIVFVLLLTTPFFVRWPAIVQMQSVWQLLAGVVILATAANLLFYWAIEREKISEVEPFLLFNPLVAILIAGVFYSNERIWPVYLAAGVASLVLVWSHWRKHKLVLTRGLTAIVGFSLIYGLEASAIKTLLTVYDPIALYLIRSVFVLLALSLVAWPNFKIIKRHHLAIFGVLGALAVISVVAAYTAFQLRGLSETIFVFTLSPVLIYVLSVIFLRERWRTKNIIASLIITGLVVWVSLMK